MGVTPRPGPTAPSCIRATESRARDKIRRTYLTGHNKYLEFVCEELEGIQSARARIRSCMMYKITDEPQLNRAKAYQNNPAHSYIDFRQTASAAICKLAPLFYCVRH